VLKIQQSMPVPERIKVNKAELAEAFGISLPTVEQWIRGGCPVIERGARGRAWVLNLLDVARWRYAVPEANDEGFDPDRASPKDRKDWFDSEFRRRQLQERDAELIPAAEVERGLADLVSQVVRTLDTLGDVLERDAGITGEAVERVNKVTDAARDELYGRVRDGLSA
jgi:transcriptional regulator with XRE-family HTH domain